MKHIPIFVLVAVVLWSCIGLSGCSKGPTYQRVEGIVTFKGKPLSNASVAFIPIDLSMGTLFAAGTTDENGAFVLSASLSEQPNKGTTVGEYFVTITRYQDEPSRFEPSEHGPIPIRDSLIPKKYSNQEQSGLKAVVERKKVNEFTFDLN